MRKAQGGLGLGTGKPGFCCIQGNVRDAGDQARTSGSCHVDDQIDKHRTPERHRGQHRQCRSAATSSQDMVKAPGQVIPAGSDR